MSSVRAQTRCLSCLAVRLFTWQLRHLWWVSKSRKWRPSLWWGLDLTSNTAPFLPYLLVKVVVSTEKWGKKCMAIFNILLAMWTMLRRQEESETQASSEGNTEVSPVCHSPRQAQGLRVVDGLCKDWLTVCVRTVRSLDLPLAAEPLLHADRRLEA